MLNDKQYDDALKMLDAKHGDAFSGLYADLRGDAHSAAGRTAEARTAYTEALAKFDAKSQYRNYVQVKLDSLGAAAPIAAAAGRPLHRPLPQLCQLHLLRPRKNDQARPKLSNKRSGEIGSTRVRSCA